MSSESDSNSKSRDRLPFEPMKSKPKPQEPSAAKSEQNTRSGREKAPKKESKTNSVKPATATPKSSDPKPVRSSKKPAAKASTDIPEVITRRMVSRMGLFCGLPSIAGILVFLVSYQAVTHAWFQLPTVAVLFVSLGCFGLGVVGLSYGALSASWDEDKPGSLLGWPEFITNFGRMTGAWKEAGEKNRNQN